MKRRISVLFVLLLMLSMGNAWAGSYYYATLTAKVADSDKTKGKVFVSDAQTLDETAFANTPKSVKVDAGEAGKNSTFYAWARPARGYKFTGWTIPADVSVNQNNNGVKDRIYAKASSEDGGEIKYTITATWSDIPVYNVTYLKPEESAYSYHADYEYYVVTADKEKVELSTDEQHIVHNEDIVVSSYTSDVIKLSVSGTNVSRFVAWYETKEGGSETKLSTSSTYTYRLTKNATIRAEFLPVPTIDVTYLSPIGDGTYTVYYLDQEHEVRVGDADWQQSCKGISVKAHAADGYRFFCWYTVDGSGTKTKISYDEDGAFSFDDNTTIGAWFVPESQAMFRVGDMLFANLNDANTYAISASPRLIVLEREGVLPAGDYTISSGVSLLIPYGLEHTGIQTKPLVVTAKSTLSAYKTLQLEEGANLVVNGVLNVGGQMMSAGGGNSSAYVTGTCGVIDLSKGGHIEMRSGSFLYCWGYITGQDQFHGNNTRDVGTITVKSGATVWENFSVGDWRGGTATSDFYFNSEEWRFFPFQSYSIHNIEAPITFEYGSIEKNYINIYGGGGTNEADFILIGSSSSLFKLNDSRSFVTKWYDATTDLTCYELSGTASIDALILSVMGTDLNSAEYNLPINNNMHIILRDCDMQMTSPMIIQAGAVMEIKQDASLTITSNIYVYDTDDWGMYMNKVYFRSFPHITSHANRGDEKVNTLSDAVFIVDGRLTVTNTGQLYTSTGGASILGNGGGVLEIQGNIPSATTIVQCTGVSAREDSPMYPAKLYNENNTYTATINNTTFYNVHGRWYKSADKDEKADHTYSFTYLSDGASGSNLVTPAVYTVNMADYGWWTNVAQDGTCTNNWNDASGNGNIYHYDTSASKWLQMQKTETENVYGGSNNNLYMPDECGWASMGETDDDCLYTIDGVKKALIDGHFVVVAANTADEAWHDAADATSYYLCFAGCQWHSATPVDGSPKAYEVDGVVYIWKDGDWQATDGGESPFFYTINEKNLKDYWMYSEVAGEWVAATPRVSVVGENESMSFLYWEDAITYSGTVINPVVTVLADIHDVKAAATIIPISKSNGVTIDLNGHIIESSAAKTIAFNGPGKTLTITDNSAEQNGQIRVVYDSGVETDYAVVLTAGTLNMEAGTIYAENVNTGSKARSACVYVTGGYEFNLRGGTLEAFSPAAYAYGIYGLANSTVNMYEGTTIRVRATTSTAYGMLAYGATTIYGGEITAEAGTTTAYGVYMNAVGAALTMTGGSVFAEAKGSNFTKATDAIAYGIVMSKEGTATISGTARVSALVSNASYGQNARGISCAASTKLTVEGDAQVEAISYYKTAYGIVGTGAATEASRGVITIRGNAQVTGKARTNAFGIQSTGIVNVESGVVSAITEGLADKAGSTSAYGINIAPSANADASLCFYGTLNVTGGTISALAATGTAYGVWVNVATKLNTDKTAYNTLTAQASIKNATISAITGTSTKAYGIYTYQDNGSTTIENSTITVTSGTTDAYGVYVDVYKNDLGAMSGNSSVTLTNNDIAVTAGAETLNTTAYGVYVRGQQYTIASASEEKYIVGEYASAGEAVVTGGTVNVTGTTSVSGVYVGPTVTTTNGGASATPRVTINGGTYNVSGTKETYGIYTRGTTILSNATVDAVGRTGGTVYGVYVNGTGNKTTINSGSYSGTAYTTISAGVRIAAGDLEINGGEFHALSKQATATKAGDSGAYGIYIPAGFPMTIKNATFTAEATKPKYCQKIYGIYALSDVELINCNTTATSDNTYAYGTYVKCANATIKGGTHTGIVKGSALTKAGAAYGYGVFVDADTKATITGATCVGQATEDNNKFCQYVYGIYANSNAEVDVADCNLSANGALNYTYGVLSLGDVTLTNNTISSTTTGTTAYGIFANASTAGVIGKITMESGTVNVSGTTTAYGGYANFAPKVSTSALYYSEAYAGVLTINGGEFNVTTTTGATAEGVRSFVTCEINVGTFNIQPKTTTAVGVRIYDGTTTINGGTFNVTATTNTAYGVCPWAEVNANYGYLNQGTVVVNDGTFVVKTLGGATAYGVYTYAAKKASFHPAKLTAATDLNAPDQACAATATINGGTFDVKASTKTSYGIYTVAKQTQGSAVAEAKTYVNDGFFHVENGDASAADAVYVGALKECHPIVGGHFNVKKGLTSSTSSKNYVNAPYRVLDCPDIDLKDTYPYEVGEGYKVTFKNGSTVLQEGYVKVGLTPVYTGTTPTKDADAQYTYTFREWSPAIEAVSTADQVYTAQFDQTLRSYTITWQDEEGIVLDTDVLDYGATPSHDALTKEATAEYSYEWRGWTPAIEKVSGDATYKSLGFTAIPNSYTLTWNLNGGTITVEGTAAGSVAYNTALTAPEVEKAGYIFEGWNPDVPETMPAEDATYTAQWQKIPSVAEVIPAGGGAATPYETWAEAVTAANASAGCTLRLLYDITNLTESSVLTNTLTLDLNGHELSGTVTKLININGSGKTVTITDNSDEQTGLIATQVDANARCYCVYLTVGTLNIEGGTIRATNEYEYNSSSAKATQATAVYVAAKYTCNISGGRLESFSTYAPYGLQVAGSATASSRAKAYVTGGEIYAESTQVTEAAGIYDLGIVEMSGGTVTAKTKTTTARGVYVAASTSKYAGTFTMTGGTVNSFTTTTTAHGVSVAVATASGKSYAGQAYIQGGEITATAGTTTAYGVYVGFVGNGGAANTTADPKYYYYTSIGYAKATISGGTITAKTASVNGSTPTTSCYGVYSLGETEITGGTITARPTTTTAYGVYSADGSIHISGNPTILAEATTKAYGAYAGHYYPSTFKLGYMGLGNLIIDGGEITARTTSTTTAYGLYVSAVSKAITSTSSGYYPNPTPYVGYGSATVNGGTITAIAKTSTASAIYTAAPVTGIVAAKNTAEAISESETVEPVVNINGGKFKAFTNLTTPATCLTVTGTNHSVLLAGGYYGKNTNLASYAVDGKQVMDNTDQPELGEGYLYKIDTPDFGDWMDIVVWDKDSVSLNMNGYSAENGAWMVKIGGTEKTSGNRQKDRTLSFTGLTLNGGELLNIEVYGGTTQESVHNYTIPYIYDGEWTNGEPSDGASIYVKSGTLTIDKDITAGRVVVCPGAELAVTGGELTISENLILRGKVWDNEQPILTLDGGSISCEHVYYTRIIADKSAYYPFGLPFASKVEDVFLSNGVVPSYGETANWNLKKHNGTRQANGESNAWDNVTLTDGKATIEANTYYLIGSGSAYYREYYFPITLGKATTSMPIAEYAGAKAANAGWNGLCSPYTGIYHQQFSDPSEAVKITTKNDDNRTWWQRVAQDMYPFYPFFYQTEAAGTLTFGSELTFSAPASVAARAQAEQQNVRTQWVQVRLSNDRGEQDELNLYLHPLKFTTGYERRYDLQKMLGEGSERPQTYTEMTCGKLAFNALPDSVAATRIPVGVVPGSATELTFSLGVDEYLDRVEAIYLVDDALGYTVNLLQSDYTWSTEDGVDGRFYLTVEVARSPQVATDILSTDGADRIRATKMIIDDMLYIQVGEHYYDATGKIVK